MSATMLQLIQQATAEMGLSVPNSVAGNTATDTVQQLALLNAAQYELQREYDWQKMTIIFQFQTTFTSTTGDTTDGSAVITNIPDTTGLSDDYQVQGVGINNAAYIESVDSATQVTMTQPATATGTGVALTFSQVKYPFPAGFDRVIDRTDWDKSQHWEMLGPETPQQWEWLTSGYISTGPRVRFRLLQGKFQIWPALAAVHTLGFEYQSKFSVYSAAAAAAGTQPDKQAFTVDTDQSIFPDRLLVLALKRKYFMVKGFQPIFEKDYMTQLDISKAADGGSATLSFAPRISTILIGWENVPDSSYGS